MINKLQIQLSLYCFMIHKIQSKIKNSTYAIFVNDFKSFARCAYVRIHLAACLFCQLLYVGWLLPATCCMLFLFSLFFTLQEFHLVFSGYTMSGHEGEGSKKPKANQDCCKGMSKKSIHWVISVQCCGID